MYVVCVAVLCAGTARAEIILDRLSTLFLPSRYEGSPPGTPVYEFGSGSTEQGALDATRHIVYTLGTQTTI